MTNTPNGRFLKCDFIDFGGIKNLYFNINLKKTAGESLNEIAPFERDRKYFYLKRFVPKFVAGGIIRVGGMEYSLNEQPQTLTLTGHAFQSRESIIIRD